MKEEILCHLEAILGEPVSLTTGKDGQGEDLPFAIAEFADQPVEGAVSFVTVGLSDFLLKQENGPENSQDARHELVFCTYREMAHDDILSLMWLIANDVKDRREAITLGEVQDLAEPVVPGSPLSAIFYYDPIYFPEPLAILETVQPPVVFAWMIPITAGEMRFIADNGPEAFNRLLADQDPDLMDLKREGLKTAFM